VGHEVAAPDIQAESPSGWWSTREPDPIDPFDVFRDLPVGEAGERFDIAQAPWVRAIWDWWMDPRVEWIYLIQGSQTSKTTTMMGLLLYAARHDPDPAMWIAAIEQEADKFVVQRLKPFIEQADSTAKSDRKVDWRKNDIRLYHQMLVHLAWATSARKLRSWPCRYLFGDEVGVWPSSLADVGDPLDFVKKRTRRYRNRKGIFATTPSSEHHPSWITAKASNFARWYVPCPECHEYQYLAFRGLKFGEAKSGDRWDHSLLPSSTYYECPYCAARMTDHHKASMIARGRLQYVDPDTGDLRPLRSHVLSRTLQVPATYSLFTPWWRLAAMFLDAKAKGTENLRIFITDETAEPWRETTDSPTVDVLADCIDEERLPGEVPSGTLAITVGADIQEDRIYYVVRAWGPLGRSWLIRHGMIPRTDDRSLDTLDDVIRTDYEGMAVNHAFIDSGYTPESVYRYCQDRPNASPCKGASGEAGPPVDPAKRRTRTSAGRPVNMVNTTHFKNEIHSRIRIRRNDPNEWRLHAEVDADYLRQIVAEHRNEKIVNGRTVLKWELHDHSSGNHYLDAEVYAMACGWFPVGVQRMEAAAGAAGQSWAERLRASRARRDRAGMMR
jgi:phage terminase large subunit GpA-like protein